MPQNINHRHQSPCRGCEREIETVPVEEAIKLVRPRRHRIGRYRDIRELHRDGKVPGAFHCPRGMLEFWIDPQSVYHKPVFALVNASCSSAPEVLRSALAAQTAQSMGLKPVAHIKGGFGAWKKAGGPIEAPEVKTAKPGAA